MKAGSAPDLIITTETSGGAGARSPQPPLDDEVAERTPFRVVSVDGGVRLERCDRALSYRDLHRLVGKAAAATPDPDPACQREANEANLEALYYEREDETDSLGLYRILRRKACIVLSFPIAGALIYSDPSSADGVSVLLLLPDTAALLAAVESDLNARPSLGLDLRALTAVLNLLFRHFRSRVREQGAAAEQGAGSIEALIGVLHSLNEVVSGAQAALKCLAKLEEDDRAPLCLLPPDAKGRQANALEELLEHTTDLIEVSRDRAQWLTEKVEADITTQHEKAAGSERGLQNRLTQFQLRINLVTMVFAMCSMISGFFGMNLSNGWCGPEGCQVLGTLDFGRAGFAVVIFSSLIMSILATLAFYYFEGGHALFPKDTLRSLYRGAPPLLVRASFYTVAGSLILFLLVLKNLSIYFPTPQINGW